MRRFWILMMIVFMGLSGCATNANATKAVTAVSMTSRESLVPSATVSPILTIAADPNFVTTTTANFGINLTPECPATSTNFPRWYVPEGVSEMGALDPNNFDFVLYLKGRGTIERIAVRLHATEEGKSEIVGGKLFYITDRSKLRLQTGMVAEYGGRRYALLYSTYLFD